MNLFKEHRSGKALRVFVGVAVLILAVVACSSESDPAPVTTVAPPTVPFEDWVSEATAVCAEFQDTFVEGEWAGAGPYTVASKKLAQLSLPSEGTAEAFTLAMEDAAAAYEAFAIQIEQNVGPDEGWDLTEDGKVWVTPAGEAFFMSAPSDIPEEFGLAALAARDELERSAEAAGLDLCTR